MLINAFHPVFIARLESPPRLPRLVDFIPVPQPHEQPSTDILRDPKIPREQNHHRHEIMHKVLIKHLARHVPTSHEQHITSRQSSSTPFSSRPKKSHVRHDRARLEPEH